MWAPNFRSVGITVQPVERKQTDTQTDATENITSSANAGDKYIQYGNTDNKTNENNLL